MRPPRRERQPDADVHRHRAGVAGTRGRRLRIYAASRASRISDQISSHNPSTPWPGNIRELQKTGEDYKPHEVISLVLSGAW